MDLLKEIGIKVNILSYISYLTILLGYPKKVGDKWYWFTVDSEQEFMNIRHTLTTEKDVLEKLCQIIQSGDRFVDVGAHYGVVSRIASENGASVTAIEASSDNFVRLKSRLSKLDSSPLALNVAVADKPGTVSLNTSSDSQSNSIIGEEGSTKVESHRLDDIVEDIGIEPDVVKIDVEGAENCVLRGGLEAIKCARAVFCEIHPQALEDLGEDVDFVEEELSGLGFDIEHIGELTDESHMIVATKMQ